MGKDFVLTGSHTSNANAIGIRRQREVILHAHLRHHEPEFTGKLATDPGDPRHQWCGLAVVDHVDQAVTDVEGDWCRIADVAPLDQMLGLRILDGRNIVALCLCGAHAGPADCSRDCCSRQDQEMRHARQHAEQAKNAGHWSPGAGRAKFAADLAREIKWRGYARHDGGCRNREEECRDLRNQRIADGEENIGLCSLSDCQTVTDSPKHKTAEDIDEQDQQSCNSIAFDELGRTVHRPVKIGFGRDFLAAGFRLVRCYKPGIEVGIDCHLLAGQRIEREAGRHFRDPACALGNDDQVDDHQDGKDENADDIVATDQEGAEGFNDMACRARSLVTIHQDDARRGDVERKAEEGCQQQHSREGRKV